MYRPKINPASFEVPCGLDPSEILDLKRGVFYVVGVCFTLKLVNNILAIIMSKYHGFLSLLKLSKVHFLVLTINNIVEHSQNGHVFYYQIMHDSLVIII